MGIGKAHRELAREMKVDPYSDNVILQAELNRVAQISGSVGKITNILIRSIGSDQHNPLKGNNSYFNSSRFRAL